MRLIARFPRPRCLMVGCMLAPLAFAAAASAEKKPASPAPAQAKPAATPAAQAPQGKTPAALAFEAKQAAAAAEKATHKAAAILLKEYQAGTAKDAKTGLRTKSEFFSQDKQGVTEDSIMNMLCSVISPDAAADSYIKWQMLSALPAKDDEKALPRMILAYRGASEPYPRPGMSASEKAELDAAIRNMKNPDADTINAVNDKFKVFVDAWDVHNNPVMDYREAMDKRLPMSAEGIIARLEDGHARQSAGIDSEKFGLRMRDDIRKWDASNPPAPLKQEVAATLLKYINEQGGIPAKPKAQAPSVRGEVFADALPLDNNARAPVILAAGYKPPTYGGNNMYNNKMPGKQSPPSYYSYVKVDGTGNKLAWATATAKFIAKDQMVELYESLNTAGAAPMVPAKP